MKGWTLILFILPGLPASAQPVKPRLQKANEFYKQAQYAKALEIYDQVLSWDTANVIAKFNRANTNYRLGKADEAIRGFEDISFKARERSEKARAEYNKGVVLSNQKKLEESIEAYKSSLRIDPHDKDARENLQKALLELKAKTPPPKKDDKKKQQNKKQQQKEKPKMNPKEAEQNLKLLEQKEKELLKRMQSQKTKSGTGGKKDW